MTMVNLSLNNFKLTDSVRQPVIDQGPVIDQLVVIG